VSSGRRAGYLNFLGVVSSALLDYSESEGDGISGRQDMLRRFE
jgi:hypothetical protein